MTSRWHQKKAKQAEEAFERELQSRTEAAVDTTVLTRTAAMGGGDEELFEKKLSKEEKKALAKAKREAKRKGKKNQGDNDDDDDDDDDDNKKLDAKAVLQEAQQTLIATSDVMEAGVAPGAGAVSDDGIDHEAADALAAAGTICTFSASRKGVDARARDINVTNFTLQHMGAVLLDETEIVLNHGNRYGLIGRNGCGKSTLLRALGARAVPIPNSIDIFFLKEEVEPSDTMTALDAVMSVDEERLKLEKQAEDLNHLMAQLVENPPDEPELDADGQVKTAEEIQEEVMEALNLVYERLDALDAATAEVRARSILKGLGFTHEMQSKKTKDFSGGWRMRVSLARALFIQPVCLLLDEPTNHLDMEAVIWLEQYLSKWNRILLLVSHSQDFLNNVCSHMIHFTNRRKLVYYDGNYDQFVKTKTEKEENQWKQYRWEQEQIKSMKEYIARFGHGTAKNAKQAQSKEKVLQKMIRAGLTEKPEEEKPLNFKFNDPGALPPPVLAFHDVSFGYPGCEPLYTNVNFGVDLDSRVALVGPNGAGKTTLVKLMAGELQPTLGDIRPHGHLKLGRFTQHFVDVLDLEKTPLEFFEELYPGDPRDEQRKYLGRFGVSGAMQVQKMAELSDGQKSRVVFAKLGRDVPHILLLDEPTNHLDMESIDALAKAVNEFEGGMVLVSHDMRLISQVAKEIWICDDKTITPYRGDIMNFKMDMRKQMGIDGDGPGIGGKLRGDASVKATDKPKEKLLPAKPEPKLEVVKPKAAAKIVAISEEPRVSQTSALPEAHTKPALSDDATVATSTSAGSATTVSNGTVGAAPKKYIPPHLRKKMSS
ncbi:ABC transporter ATP-binding protein [Nitzschia inconspicua]|uniref:ABC transporter ATP-binding protein n=1 Tax=Nitzschia inconspicua TaxID=303405 RepID=A0A9K3LY04_9STRA|nr:ABC transporter ATP-binding protein [Nitzschia inconspicua]